MVVTRFSQVVGSNPATSAQWPENASDQTGSQQGTTSTSRDPDNSSFQKPLTPGRRQVYSPTPLYLLDLPAELIERVLNHLPYKEVSRCRRVCQTFNSVASTLLTKTFYLLQNQTSQLLQSIRMQMPRRESLRKKHPLSSQCDILETVNMRFDLLHMTFGKHMERKFICFFAGEILDEVVRVTRMAKQQGAPSERLTDELCDLSVMAMEYFREHLDARLRHSLLYARSASETICNGWSGAGSTCASSVADGGASSMGGSDSVENLIGDEYWDDEEPPTSSQLAVVNSRIAKLSKTLKKNNSQIVQLRRDMRSQRQRSQDQSRLISEYAVRIDEHDKKLDDASIKFSALLQELSECRRELGQWRQLCDTHSPPSTAPPSAPSQRPSVGIDAAAAAHAVVEADEERVPVRNKRKLSDTEDRATTTARAGSSCKLRRRHNNTD